MTICNDVRSKWVNRIYFTNMNQIQLYQVVSLKLKDRLNFFQKYNKSIKITGLRPERNY